MCYRFELLEFEDCLFENIDATYILHLEGNGRLDHIHDQLKTYHPTKKVYLVYNKGYKKCAKDLHIQSSGYDITHANITAFEHAQQYKHVLVLEDDFIFSKEVVDHTKQVDTFLERDTKFVYQLGSNPIFALPIDMYHYRVLGLLGHANIYSSSCRTQLMHDFDTGKIIGSNGGLDSYLFKTVPIYMYHKPLCYQTFPMTENRKSWSGIIPDSFILWTNLENEPEPGFTILYWFAKLIPFVLLFLLWTLLSCLTSLKGKRLRR